ncbi:reverse transcriptase [Gossypium australe]|uniref:Reverse transcriptase n=1 Tax=Gossypium australe TaxID=47621 RepID=A0A5B6V4L7_9ROSI|nr:reverse transcriptase [Gossypium australe]
MCIPKAKGGLGFKDLSKFNLALLAKQGWKLIMQPDCLFARVMKAKYFPTGDFMSANLGSYPSYTWRSIWEARQILEEGVGWRIGNGESVNIWNDRWLPGPGSGRVTCQNMIIRFTQVSDLFDRETNTWKQETIRSLLGEEQLESILTIPLASSRPRDELIWRGDNTRVYTAKSGYRWLITEGVPSKIRILMWKIAHNYLPTLHNLSIRRLAVNSLCPVCQSEEESVEHLFRDCPFTHQVLSGVGTPLSTHNNEISWKNWLAADFEKLNIEACKIRSIAYWAIWYNRNKLYHEGVREHVNDVIGFIKAYYSEISCIGERLRTTNESTAPVWKPPANDIIKINFDASFNRLTRCSNSGIIARNKEGLTMAACTFPWENIPNPVMAEARACLQAIIMAEEMGFQDVCIEGDALSVIRKLKAAEEDRSCISNLIKEIKGKVVNFRSVSFKYVPREANKVAHAMAQEGARYEQPRYWIEEAPHAVEVLVNQEKRNGIHGS